MTETLLTQEELNQLLNTKPAGPLSMAGRGLISSVQSQLSGIARKTADVAEASPFGGLAPGLQEAVAGTSRNAAQIWQNQAEAAMRVTPTSKLASVTGAGGSVVGALAGYAHPALWVPTFMGTAGRVEQELLESGMSQEEASLRGSAAAGLDVSLAMVTAAPVVDKLRATWPGSKALNASVFKSGRGNLLRVAESMGQNVGQQIIYNTVTERETTPTELIAAAGLGAAVGSMRSPVDIKPILSVAKKRKVQELLTEMADIRSRGVHRTTEKARYNELWKQFGSVNRPTSDVGKFVEVPRLELRGEKGAAKVNKAVRQATRVATAKEGRNAIGETIVRYSTQGKSPTQLLDDFDFFTKTAHQMADVDPTVRSMLKKAAAHVRDTFYQEFEDISPEVLWNKSPEAIEAVATAQLMRDPANTDAINTLNSIRRAPGDVAYVANDDLAAFTSTFRQKLQGIEDDFPELKEPNYIQAVSGYFYVQFKKLQELQAAQGVEVTTEEFFKGIDFNKAPADLMTQMYLFKGVPNPTGAPDLTISKGKMREVLTDEGIFIKNSPAFKEWRKSRDLKGHVTQKQLTDFVSDRIQATANAPAGEQFRIGGLAIDAAEKAGKAFVWLAERGEDNTGASRVSLIHELAHVMRFKLSRIPGALDDIGEALHVKDNEWTRELDERLVNHVLALTVSKRFRKDLPDDIRPYFEYLKDEIYELYGISETKVRALSSAETEATTAILRHENGGTAMSEDIRRALMTYLGFEPSPKARTRVPKAPSVRGDVELGNLMIDSNDEIAARLASTQDLPEYIGSFKTEAMPKAMQRLFAGAGLKREVKALDEIHERGIAIANSQHGMNRILKKAKRGEALTPEEYAAADVALTRSTTELLDQNIELREQLFAGQIDQAAYDAGMKAIRLDLEDNVDGLIETMSNAQNSAGRLLRYVREHYAMARVASTWMEAQDLLKSGKLTQPKKELLEEALELALVTGSWDKRRLDSLLGAMHTAKKEIGVTDLVKDLFINNLLSGFSLMWRNPATNAVWRYYNAAHNFVTAGVDATLGWQLPNYSRKHFLASAKEFAKASTPVAWTKDGGFRRTPATIEGQKTALQILKTGRHPLLGPFAKVDIGEEAWTYSKYYKYAPAVEFPGRVQKMFDAWQGTIAVNAEYKALAMRDAVIQHGIQFGKTKAARKEIQDAVQSTYKKMIAEFSVPYDQMSDLGKVRYDEAWNFARRAVFTEYSGQLTRAMLGLRKSLGLVGTLQFPFMVTQSNIVRYGLELTPMVGLLSNMMRKGVGKLDTAEIVAKQVEGLGFTMLAWQLAAAGRLTGPTPRDSALRELRARSGIPENAVKIGDHWVQMEMLGPLGVPLALAASTYDAFHKASIPDNTIKDPENQAATVAAKMGNALLMGAASIAEYLESSTWYGNFEAVLEAPQAKSVGYWRRQASHIAAGFIPYSSGLRELNYAILSGRHAQSPAGLFIGERDRRAGGTTAQMLLGQFAEAYMSENSEWLASKKIDVFGKKVTLPGGIFNDWLGAGYRKDKMDFVDKELLRLHYTVGYPLLGTPNPDKKITIGKQDFQVPEAIHEDFLIYTGAIMKDAVAQVMKRTSYEQLPDDRKVDILAKAVGKARSRGHQKLRIEVLRYYNKR